MSGKDSDDYVQRAAKARELADREANLVVAESYRRLAKSYLELAAITGKGMPSPPAR